MSGFSQTANLNAEPRRVLDTALETPGGIRVYFKESRLLINFRQRLYRERVLDRERTEKTYNGKYGRVSMYDELLISTGEDKDGHYIHIEKPSKPQIVVRSVKTGKEVKV